MQFSQEAVRSIANDPANAEAIRESQKLFQGIMARSTTDRAFRDQLLASPKDAITAQYREMFGKEMDAAAGALDIQFVESQGDFTYVLPNRVDAEAELSESELAAVAGGITPTVSLVATYALGVGVTLGIVWAVNQLND
jgi:ketosteroid isomerase-like protein